jgi:hypothetical protein
MFSKRALMEIVAKPDGNQAHYTDETVALALELLFPPEKRAEAGENLDVFYTGDLARVKLAILLLGDGDTDKVAEYGEAANKDYRDVLYWVDLKLQEMND